MRKLHCGLLLLLVCAMRALADGPPFEYGPTDPHRIEPNGLNQKILVIYAQANDYRIPSGQLAALNGAEDPKRTAFANWFSETSWGRLTMDVTAQRRPGGEWYTLPNGLLEYVRPGQVNPMQVRNPGGETATNPTPPASVTASAGGSGSSFTGTDAGNYRYAVTSFRNGQESSMVKVAGAVAVAAGQNVTLTINRAAATDVDRYLIYRTFRDAADVDTNYSRVGQINVAGPVTNFVDTGFKNDDLGDWHNLIGAAIEAAHADVNYDQFDGIAVVLFSPFLRGQAGFGTETFTFTGGSINIQGTFVSTATGFGRFTHEMGHWLDLPDLYGIFFNWDTMDCACDGQFYAWEKDHKLGYLASPDQLVPVTRPAPGNPDFNQSFIIHPSEVEDTFGDRVTAVKITSSENVHYYVEGRKRISGRTSDQATPADNQVLVTEAIDVFPQTIIPQRNVRLLTALSSGSATFQPDPNVEITFTSTNAGSPPSYNVNVRVKAQPQSDPAIDPWNPPPWESPDVFVDSSREGGGFMTPATATLLPGNGEHAWVNHVNRVWARVRNAGDGPATGVVVHFQVNTPGGMGDSGQFIDLVPTAPFNLAPGEVKFVFTEWTPTVASHTCIKAEIQHVAGEASIYNNLAQENVNDFYTGSASPWHTFSIPIDVANPYKEAKRATIRVEGLPEGWKANIDHRWVDLAGEERKLVNLSITPKGDAPACTTVALNVYGVMLIDDYVQRFGGITPIVHLANPIGFRLVVRPLQRDEKSTFAVGGCTMPPQPNSEIALILQDNGGHDQVVFVTTDASGCFSLPINVPPDKGPWTIRPYFKGNDCNAPTEGTKVPLDPSRPTGDTGGFDTTNDPKNPFGGGRGAVEVGVFTGGNWPLGKTNKALDPGFLFGVDVLRRVATQWRLGLQAAWHQFDEGGPGGDNVGIANLSFLANHTQPFGPYRTFIAFGPGAYGWDGSWHLGAQVGVGLEVPVSTDAYLMTGINGHIVNGGTPSDPRWLDAYLGFRIRWP